MQPEDHRAALSRRRLRRAGTAVVAAAAALLSAVAGLAGSGPATAAGGVRDVVRAAPRDVVPGATHTVVPAATHTVVPAATHTVVPGTPYRLAVPDDHGATTLTFPIAAGQVPVLHVSDLTDDDPADATPAALKAEGGFVDDARPTHMGALRGDGILRADLPVARAGTFSVNLGAPRRGAVHATVTVTLAVPRVIDVGTGQRLAVDPAADGALPVFRLHLRAGDRPYLVFGGGESAFPGRDVGLGLSPAGEAPGFRHWPWPRIGSALLYPGTVDRDGDYLLRVRVHAAVRRFAFVVNLAVTTSAGTLPEGTPVLLTASGLLSDVDATVPAPGGAAVRVTLTWPRGKDSGDAVVMIKDRFGREASPDQAPQDGPAVVAPSPMLTRGPYTVVLRSHQAEAVSVRVLVEYRRPLRRAITPGQVTRVVAPAGTEELRFELDAEAGQQLAFATETSRWSEEGRVSSSSTGRLTRPDGTEFEEVRLSRGTVSRVPRALDATGRWTLSFFPHGEVSVRFTPYVVPDPVPVVLPADTDVALAFPTPVTRYRATFVVRGGYGASVAASATTLASRTPQRLGVPPVGLGAMLRDGEGDPYPGTPVLVGEEGLLTPTLMFDRDTTVTLDLEPLGFTTGTAVVRRHAWKQEYPQLTTTPLAVQLSEPGRRATFRVEMETGARVGIAFSGLDLAGSGTPGVTAVLTGDTLPRSLNGGQALPATGDFYEDVFLPIGTWTLTVTAVGDTTGTFGVALNWPRTLEEKGRASLDLALTEPGDEAWVTLSAPVTETLAFQVSREGGPAPSGLTPDVRVYDADGRIIRCEIESPATTWCQVPPGTAARLPVRLFVDPAFGDTGHYRVRATGSDPQAVAWTPGQTRTITVRASTPGQDVDIAYDTRAHARAVLLVTDVAVTRSQPPGAEPPLPAVTLQYWDGATWVDDRDVTGAGTYRSSMVAVEDGPARWRLRFNADASGSLTAGLQVVQDAGGRAELGDPFEVTLDTPGMWGVYTVRADARTWPTVHAEGSTLDAYRVCLDETCSAVLGAGEAEVTMPLLATGREQELTVRPVGPVTGSVTLTLGSTRVRPTPVP